MRVLAIASTLVADAPVSRTIAIREDQTLEQLHEALRLTFGWADPHLYSFWVGGDFWDHEVPHYTAAFEMDEMDEGELSARISLADLRLKKGSTISYVFDFGDEWRLALKVVDGWPQDEMAYPMLVDAEGTAPPQYVEDDEGD